jgi:hypothetical protein
MAAYETNIEEAIEIVIEGDCVAQAMRSFVQRLTQVPTLATEWTGTATRLWSELVSYTPDRMMGAPDWPKNARRLSDRLRRMAGALRASGIDVTHKAGSNGRPRSITIRVLPDPAAPAAAQRDGANGSGAAAAAAVSFLITQTQKMALRAAGFSDDDVVGLTPEQVHRLLAERARQGGPAQ